MKRTIGGLVFLGVVLPLLAFAQTSGFVNGSVGSATAVAGSGTVQAVTVAPAVFDHDQTDDDVVQINNLRIEEISGGGFPVVIWATADYGVGCLRYASAASAKATSIACPMPASQFYQIEVDADTALLLRTRVRANISQFEPGDRINVYGFMDRQSNTIEAMIVRNIDKPERAQYIQLNSVSVVSVDVAARQLTVQKEYGGGGCLDYSQGGVSMPCPMGVEADRASAPSAGASLMYYPRPYTYVVQVPASAKIMDKNRAAIRFGDIAVGDTLNVYGAMRRSEGTVTAMIVRDLSKPSATPVPQSFSYSVWTDKPVYAQGEKVHIFVGAYNQSGVAQTLQFNSGCQASYTADSYSPNQICTMALTSVTIPAYSWKVWTLVHDPAEFKLGTGQHTVVGRVIGYGESKTSITVQ